ncbi:MAG: hypothetical protein ACM3SU_13610 [Acidobacteriota bacterium]
MSLIDDALRRAQAAQTGSPGTGLRVPMPLPDPGRFRRRRLRLMAAVAILAALAVGAGFLWVRRSVRGGEPPRARATPPAGASAAAAAAAPTPAPETTATLVAVEVPRPAAGIARGAAASATRAPRGVEAAGTATPAPASPPTAAAPAKASPIAARAILRAEPPAAPVILPPVEVSNASASPRLAAGERPRHAEPRPTPTAPAKTYAGTANLPSGKIQLEGIVYNESSPAALINGRVLGPGGYVSGYTVIRIEPDRVELRDENGTIILTLK